MLMPVLSLLPDHAPAIIIYKSLGIFVVSFLELNRLYSQQQWEKEK